MNSLKFPRFGNYPNDATKEDLVKYVEDLTDWASDAEEFIVFLQKQTLEQVQIKVSLENKIESVNKLFAEIATNSEFQCYVENGLIPCKAPCARNYEILCKTLKDIQASLGVKNSV